MARAFAASKGKPHFMAADMPTPSMADHGERALEWNTTQGLAYVTAKRRPSRPVASGCTPT
jgi:hypothetical protein